MPRTVSDSDLRRVGLNQAKGRADSCHRVFSNAYRPVPHGVRGLWSRVEAPLSESVPLTSLLPLLTPGPCSPGPILPLLPLRPQRVAAPTVHRVLWTPDCGVGSCNDSKVLLTPINNAAGPMEGRHRIAESQRRGRQGNAGSAGLVLAETGPSPSLRHQWSRTPLWWHSSCPQLWRA
jgi:hypothetical protein